jgi:hypothetical protein
VVRIQAERLTAEGVQQAMAVDITPFAVVADRADAPAAQTEPVTPVTPTDTPTAILTDECRWTGTWSTTFGTMRLTQSDVTVSGDYEHDQGQIRGTVTGRVLSGTWDEAPSRQPPGDAGEIEFTMADDCQSFTGRWRYDSGGDWQPGWDGQLEGGAGPTATPPATVPPTATLVPPTATAVPSTATAIPPTAVPPTATVMPSTSTPVPPPTATPVPPTPMPPTAIPPSTVTVGQTPTSPGTGNTCNCEELAAAQATIAAQATRIAELEGQLGMVSPTPTAASPSPPTGTGTGQETPPAADFISPDLAECTMAPRDLAALQAIAAVPDQAASDALLAAMAIPGLDAPAGQPADAATAEAVEATYRQMTACFNAGRDLAAYALWTDKALRQIRVQPPATDAVQAVPSERQTAVRVTEVRVLPDGRVVALWEERSALFADAVVQVLVRSGDRYLIDETLDLAIA